jgi:parallel beta-helix repeat protein
MLTTFAFGGGTLNLDIDTIGADVSLTATGANSYVFTSSDLFTGTEIPGQLVGNGTNTLTITTALGLTNAFVTDSVLGVTVDVAGGVGASTWDADLAVALAIPGSGTINVTAATTFSGAHGVSLSAAGVNVNAALSTATGAITLDADEGLQATAVAAGTVIGTLGSVTSSGGSIAIAGRGGDAILGGQVGVSILGLVRAGDNGTSFGTVTITGLGGASGGDGNHGVEIAPLGSVSSTGGAVSISGTGSATNGSNAGVVIGGTVSTTSALGGPGDVVIEGFGGGGAGTGLNFGTWLKSTGRITTVAGDVSVTGHQGVGDPSIVFPFTTSPGIVDLNGTVGSTSGDLAFTAESMLADIFATGSIATTGTVSIRNLLLGQEIELGADTNPLFEAIVASRLVIGRSDILPIITQAGSPQGILTLSPGMALELIGSSISLQADISTVGAEQIYSGPVLLGDLASPADVTLTAATATFRAPITGGGRALTIAGKGVFEGKVAAVKDLSVTGTTLAAADITTTGAQTYGGAMTLGQPLVTLTATSGTFGAGVVGGGRSLAIDFGGVTAIDGATFTGIGSLSTGGGGQTTLTGNLVTGSGQAYGDAVLLQGDTKLTTGGGALVFSGAVDGARNLTLATGAGLVSFNAAVGAGVPLASLAVNSAGGLTALSTIALDGAAIGAATNGLVVAAGVPAIDIQTPGSTIRNFAGSGVILQSSAGSQLAGFTISDNLAYGVYVQGDSSGSRLSGNTVRNNVVGVYLNGAGGLTIDGGNQLLANTSSGIYATGLAATTTTVSGTVVDGLGAGAYGVFLDNAKNVHVGLVGAGNGNSILGTGIGIVAHDGLASSRIENNLVQGNSTGVYLFQTRNLTVAAGNQILSNSAYGLLAQGAFHDTNVNGNTISGSTVGVCLSSATGIVINGGNQILNSTAQGIYAVGDSSGTVIQGNTIAGAGSGAFGVFLDASPGVIVGGAGIGEGNVVTGHAIGLYARNGLAGATVAGNTIDSNGSGAVLASAQGLLVNGGNNVTRSSAYGVLVQGVSSGTVIAGNEIATNVIGVALSAATGVTVNGGNTITGSTAEGVYAAGTSTGSSVTSNTINGGGIGACGVFLESATGLRVGDTGGGNTVSGWNIGMHVRNLSTGSVVRANTVTGNSSGLVLTAAKGLLADGGNRFGANSAFGVLAQGDCSASTVAGNTIDANVVGIALIDALGVAVNGGNQVVGNTAHGAYVQGNAAGSSLTGNAINGAAVGAFGVFLDGAQGLMVGDIPAGGLNTIAGCSNGIYARGVLTGTTVVNNAITGNSSGMVLLAATGLAVRGGNRFIGASAFGLYASGDCDGTTIEGNTFDSNSSGVVLEGAKRLSVVDANRMVSNTSLGLYAKGDSVGTVVLGNTITGNGLNIDTSAAVGGTFQTV